MKSMLLGAVAVAATLSAVISTAQEEETGPDLADAKRAFEQADAELNEVYREVKSEISEWKFKSLQEQQKEWLSFRDARAESDAVFNGGQEFDQRETESPDYWVSLTESTKTRVEMISGWKNEHTPWAGLWTDGYGGWLLIEHAEAPAKFSFRIQVVRGPTYHMGGIAGTAKRNESAGFFSDEGDSEYHIGEEKEETWLWFTKKFDAPTIEIVGVNTQPYHGARAFFDGVYTRLRNPTDEDRETFEVE